MISCFILLSIALISTSICSNKDQLLAVIKESSMSTIISCLDYGIKLDYEILNHAKQYIPKSLSIFEKYLPEKNSIDSAYQVLNIVDTSSFDDIRKTYKAIALEWHPDKNINSNTTMFFQLFQDAYEVIKFSKQKSQHTAQENNNEHSDTENDSEYTDDFFSSGYSVYEKINRGSDSYKAENISNAYIFRNLISLEGITTIPLVEDVMILDCSYGGIKSINHDLNALSNLTRLDLSNHHISTFKLKHATLQILNLKRNFLQYISHNTFELPKLKILDLSYNELQEIDENAFASTSGIDAINLSHNYLSKIPYQMFAPLSHVRKINLEANYWKENKKAFLKTHTHNHNAIINYSITKIITSLDDLRNKTSDNE